MAERWFLLQMAQILCYVFLLIVTVASHPAARSGALWSEDMEQIEAGQTGLMETEVVEAIDWAPYLLVAFMVAIMLFMAGAFLCRVKAAKEAKGKELSKYDRM